MTYKYRNEDGRRVLIDAEGEEIGKIDYPIDAEENSRIILSEAGFSQAEQDALIAAFVGIEKADSE